jgi:hypothetical protein
MISPRVLLFLVVLTGALGVISAADSKPAFAFEHVDYFHRWSSATQHEFTPARQEDLEHWSDMITVNDYPGVDDDEKMAQTANAVLGNYERAAGKILKTSSVPASDDEPPEHFIAVAFTRPGFAEAAFAHFKIVDGKAHSFVYSHRFYGDKAADQMNHWLEESGEKIEKALLDWDPPAAALAAR